MQRSSTTITLSESIQKLPDSVIEVIEEYSYPYKSFKESSRTFYRTGSHIALIKAQRDLDVLISTYFDIENPGNTDDQIFKLLHYLSHRPYQQKSRLAYKLFDNPKFNNFILHDKNNPILVELFMNKHIDYYNWIKVTTNEIENKLPFNTLAGIIDNLIYSAHYSLVFSNNDSLLGKDTNGKIEPVIIDSTYYIPRSTVKKYIDDVRHLLLIQRIMNIKRYDRIPNQFLYSDTLELLLNFSTTGYLFEEQPQQPHGLNPERLKHLNNLLNMTFVNVVENNIQNTVIDSQRFKDIFLFIPILERFIHQRKQYSRHINNELLEAIILLLTPMKTLNDAIHIFSKITDNTILVLYHDTYRFQSEIEYYDDENYFTMNQL